MFIFDEETEDLKLVGYLVVVGRPPYFLFKYVVGSCASLYNLQYLVEVLQGQSREVRVPWIRFVKVQDTPEELVRQRWCAGSAFG